ncbi:MAG: tandem-95 repeat protein [Gammaproteobacteria bacterium]|nr:tandem-95 repeat protein [Gammaproteobacteria bacterium]
MFLNYKSILLWVVILLTGSLNEVKSQSIVAKSYRTHLGDVNVSVTITDGPGNPKDWIGIYKDGQEPGKVDAFTWIYVDGTQSGNTGVDSETWIFTLLDAKFIAGKYKAYLLENDGFTILASTSFIVRNANEANTPPTALGQNITMDMNEACCGDYLVIELKGDDLETRPERIEFSDFWIVNRPKNGSLLRSSGRYLFYTPWGNCNGVGDNDSFTFKTFDGELYSDPATVTINIIRRKNDDKPCLSMSKTEYLHNSDSDKETVEIIFTDGPGNAKDWIGIYREDHSPGIVNYVFPDLKSLDKLAWLYVNGTTSGSKSKKSGSIQFKDFFTAGSYKAYLLEDDGFTVLAHASFKVSKDVVIDENIAPRSEGQTVNVDEDGSVSIALNGEDDDGDDLGFTVVSQPKNGTLSGTAPNLTYSPKPDFNGDDSFTYKANDGLADSNTATVAISVKTVNDLPVVFSQSANVDEDGSVTVTLKAQDNDGDNLKFTVVSQPKNGTLSGTAPNLTYSPKPDFNGDDSFTYKANDGLADSNTATVAIKVIEKDVEPVQLTLSKASYEEGEWIEISYKGGPGNTKDWIGIYKEGQPIDDGSVEYQYLYGNISGKLIFDPLSTGKYEVSFYVNDTHQKLYTAHFDVRNKVELTLSRASYEVGEKVEISYSEAPENDKDWIGIYKKGQPINDGSVQYQYLNGKKSGKLIFASLPVGKYEVHLFEDNSYKKLNTAYFKVKAEGSPRLTTSRNQYVYGETIVISYANAPGNQNDWIGLHEDGKIGSWPAIKYRKLNGQKSGVIEWDLKLEKGKKYHIALYRGWSFISADTDEFSISTKNWLIGHFCGWS